MARKRPKIAKDRPPDPYGVDVDWRLFIAVPMPEPVQELVQSTISRFPETWPVRWVNPKTAHLTLHFIGETAPERGELMRLGLGKAVRLLPAFELGSGALGVFPDAVNPKVLWLGLDGEITQLKELHRSVGRFLTGMEIPIDYQVYHPHITLGRVRDDAPATLSSEIRSALVNLEIAPDPIPFPVTEVHLVRSYLSKDGARHESIGRYPLARTGA